MASVLALARTQQFWWFISHLLSVLFYLVYQLSSIFGSAASSLAYYRYCLVMVITTYFIVLAQNKRRRGLNMLISDTNFQYLTLAAVFYMASLVIGPVNGALFPYMIFSVFHMISYFQNNLLDFIGTLPQQQQIHARIASWLEQNQPRAQIMAATAELFLVMTSLNSLVVMPIVFVNLVAGRWQVGVAYLACFVASVVFLKLRWNDSPYTKQVVSMYDAKVGSFVQRFPPLANIYHRLRDVTVTTLAPIKITVVKKSPREQVTDSARDSAPRATASGSSR